MTKIQAALGFMVLSAFSSCAAMQQSYQDNYCNQSAGYERGVNDAREGRPMDSSFFMSCQPGSKEAAIAGYQNGYGAGIASIPPQPTQINVNVGGAPAWGPVGGERRAYCEIHAFTNTFSAWGPNELEAQVRAKEKCKQQYNEMHCGDIRCRHAD
jgi:hypothetical protein